MTQQEPPADALASALAASREDLMKALPEAERELAKYRQAADELERRIDLVRRLLGMESPATGGTTSRRAGSQSNAESPPDTATTAGEGAVGKYAGLEQWLRQQPRRPIEINFGRVEDVMGVRLPPSCRRYAAHWHGWDGSAVARAIRRAGWSVRDLDLRSERLTFVPQPEYNRAHGLDGPV